MGILDIVSELCDCDLHVHSRNKLKKRKQLLVYTYTSKHHSNIYFIFTIYMYIYILFFSTFSLLIWILLLILFCKKKKKLPVSVFFFWVLGLEEKGLGWLIWRAKLVKSLGSERGNHPTMHNLNPLSETVKSVRKKKEKQSPLVLWLRASVCFYLLSRSRNRHWPISVFGPCFKFQTSVVECLKWEKRRVSSSLCFFLKSQAGNKCHSCLSASFILY